MVDALNTIIWMKTKSSLPRGQLEHPEEVFHVVNKQIWRQGVLLPHTTSFREETMKVTIHSNKKEGCEDTA
jgi:hypothetical protein